MEPEQKRGRGRPRSGITPKREIRVGPTWDEARVAATEDGEPFAVFVERALREALTRRARRKPRAEPDA